MWLASLSAHIGSGRMFRLMEAFGSARAVYGAGERALAEIGGLSARGLAGVRAAQNRGYADGLTRDCEKHGVTFVHSGDDGFPALLRGVPAMPFGLFCIGRLDDAPRVAIIGSRNCTEYGLSVARFLAKPLAEAGLAIVSGMARGVDSMAHRAALEAGGRTIAVLGTGADLCYPASNKALRRDIIENGCIVSEYPPGTAAMKHFFPHRNRIISGISLGVVVVEAGRQSGTLGTVEHAAAQGRDVLAVPGNISSGLSVGTNALIKDGAHLVQDHSDVLYALGLMPGAGAEPAPKPCAPLEPDERTIYGHLGIEPVSYETLLCATGLASGRLHFALTGLEIKKQAVKLPGGGYIKA